MSVVFTLDLSFSLSFFSLRIFFTVFAITLILFLFELATEHTKALDGLENGQTLG